MEEKSNNNKIPDLTETDLFKFLNKFKFPIIIIGLIALLGYTSYYTIDANENGVVLRLGKYHTKVGPGLHFKMPLVDQVSTVKVDYLYKVEFGYETLEADIKTQYSTSNYFVIYDVS